LDLNLELENDIDYVTKKKNQSKEGAEFVWVSECQKGEG
jgi:hypothetical protein